MAEYEQHRVGEEIFTLYKGYQHVERIGAGRHGVVAFVLSVLDIRIITNALKSKMLIQVPGLLAIASAVETCILSNEHDPIARFREVPILHSLHQHNNIVGGLHFDLVENSLYIYQRKLS